MTDKILFDHNSQTGVTEYFHDMGNGEYAIETTQDLSGLVDVAKALQNDRDGRWGDLTHVAWIPPVVQIQLMQAGILGRGLEVLDDKRYRDWLNDRDNRYFRTRLGRI
jgi:hypothetical protein